MDSSERQRLQWGCPHLCGFCLQKLYQVLKKTGGNTPGASGRGEGRRSPFEKPQHILLLTKPSCRETILSEPNLWGFYQSLADLGKGKYKKPARSPPHPYSVLPKGWRQNLEALLKITFQGSATGSELQGTSSHMPHLHRLIYYASFYPGCHAQLSTQNCNAF